MNEFTCVIDGYRVRFFPFRVLVEGPDIWCWSGNELPSSVDEKAFEMTQLLDHDPAAQLWLSSGGYGGMTLKEFLESVE